MTTPLDDAIAIFRELGWHGATPADAEHLPLGTDEQRRIAVKGLAKGEWGGFQQTSANSYGWVSSVDVDTTMLALFAVRSGVDARRAAGIMPSRIGDELSTRILAQRGPEFAARFIEAACRSNRRAWEHSSSVHGGAVVRLVIAHDLPVPENLEYLKDWAVYAAGALDAGGELFPADRGLIAVSDIASRYREHADAAVAVGLPATGPIVTTIAPAMTLGWIDRTEALDLAFRGLDSSQRPGDRKAWVELLSTGLAVTPEELSARADALVAAMSFGEPAVIEAVGPTLIGVVEDDTLIDVALVGLTVTTKRARRALLAALAARPRPAEHAVEAIAGAVGDLAASKDAAIRRPAEAVLAAWGAQQIEVADAADENVRGLWRPTPPLWEVPRFEAPPLTAEALTDAAAVLSRKPDAVVDVDVERFLVVANAVARQNPDDARSALRGVRQSWIAGLRCVPPWRAGEPSTMLDRPARSAQSVWSTELIWEPVPAREASVFQRLGEVPVLLSTPTWIDLRIDPADLVARLTLYREAGAMASEADVFLAMTRIDPGLVTPEVVAELRAMDVPIVTQTGKRLTVQAGVALAEYASAPIAEQILELSSDRGSWYLGDVTLPSVLQHFPGRLKIDRHYGGDDSATFPHWGDGASFGTGFGESSDVGAQLRQSVRRSSALGPAGAINVIGAQRGFHSAAAEDGTLAVVEAWERGLLLPGVADIRYLDWRNELTNLAKLAAACTELAEQGMLSVVWPVLDDLVLASTEASRLLSGTTELVESMVALLPEVEAAVASGLAPSSALDVPGLRAIAARSGSSRAVVAAKDAVGRLPERTAVRVEKPAEPTPDFVGRWPQGAGELPAIEDGAKVTATWVDATASTRFMAVYLELPDEPGVRYQTVKGGWMYDVQNEGQCSAVRVVGEAPTTNLPNDSWVRWDVDRQRLVVSPNRNWMSGKNGPVAADVVVPPLTTSIVAAVLGSLCTDNSTLYDLRTVIANGLFGSAAVTIAMRALLPFPDVSPARIARLIEKEPSTLPTVWPVLVESVRFAAAEGGSAPTWLNRILDLSLRNAALLREAAARGIVPAESAQWPGLREIAGGTMSATVRRKAGELVAALGL